MKNLVLIVLILLAVSCNCEFNPEQLEPGKQKMFIEAEALQGIDYTLLIFVNGDSKILTVNHRDYLEWMQIKDGDRVEIEIINNNPAGSQALFSFYVDPIYRMRADVYEYMSIKVDLINNRFVSFD